MFLHEPCTYLDLVLLPQWELLKAAHKRSPSQVFCSKQQPRCGTCPLRSMCEYALNKGPCMAAPLVEAEAGSQSPAAAGPAPAAKNAVTAGSNPDLDRAAGEEATESHAAATQPGDSPHDGVPGNSPLLHAAPRVVAPALTAADREAHVLRILAAVVESQPESSEQAPPVQPVRLELDLNRHDCISKLDLVAILHKTMPSSHPACAESRFAARLSLLDSMFIFGAGGCAPTYI